MTAAYLYANAVMYAVFAVWMTLSPQRTAAALGYQSLSASGRSEYLVITARQSFPSMGPLERGHADTFRFGIEIGHHPLSGHVTFMLSGVIRDSN